MHPGFLLQLPFKVSAHRGFIFRKQVTNLFTRRRCCGMQRHRSEGVPGRSEK